MEIQVNSREFVNIPLIPYFNFKSKNWIKKSSMCKEVEKFQLFYANKPMRVKKHCC